MGLPVSVTVDFRCSAGVTLLLRAGVLVLSGVWLNIDSEGTVVTLALGSVEYVSSIIPLSSNGIGVTAWFGFSLYIAAKYRHST